MRAQCGSARRVRPREAARPWRSARMNGTLATTQSGIGRLGKRIVSSFSWRRKAYVAAPSAAPASRTCGGRDAYRARASRVPLHARADLKEDAPPKSSALRRRRIASRLGRIALRKIARRVSRRTSGADCARRSAHRSLGVERARRVEAEDVAHDAAGDGDEGGRDGGLPRPVSAKPISVPTTVDDAIPIASDHRNARCVSLNADWLMISGHSTKVASEPRRRRGGRRVRDPERRPVEHDVRAACRPPSRCGSRRSRSRACPSAWTDAQDARTPEIADMSVPT